MKTVSIEEMSWTDFQDFIKESDLIIIPLGSTEQHGLHNPLGVDTAVAAHCAHLIGHRAKAAVAPALPFGYADGLKEFPGTITVDAELLRNLLFSYAESYVRHGARRFLFINGHGGNMPSIEMASGDLFDEYGCICFSTQWWTTLSHLNSDWPCDDHAGYYETSVMLAVNEDVVDLGAAQSVQTRSVTPELVKRTFRGAPAPLPIPMKKLTDAGNTGNDPREANAELGEAMIETYVDYNVRLIKQMRAMVVEEPQ